MEGELNPAIAAARAARQATAIDRSRISPRAGLIAAVPVTALLAIGVAVQQPVGAVTVAAGR